MISNSRGYTIKDLQAKIEEDTINNNNNEANKYPKAPSSSRQWSAFRNPRIVRVSPTFEGKDRHSKVCTVRGLRDRRIRLSVPTATQLYDLQDRLGLNQPSKVIDWLLEATKNDIDQLPPLQMPQSFGQFHSPMLFPHHDPSASQSALCPPHFFDPKIGGGSGLEWEMEASLKAKSKDKGKWVRTVEGGGGEEGHVSAHKVFPLTTSHSSLPMPFSPYYHLDASNLSLAQLGSHGFISQPEHESSHHHHQLMFCPQPATLPSLFPAYSPFATLAMESGSLDTNHLQLLSSSHSQSLLQGHHLLATSYPVRPFSLSVNPGLAHTMQGGSKESHPNQERDSMNS